MKYLVLDTEGNGLFLYRDDKGVPVPADDPRQPRLASISMILLSEDLEIEETLNFYVKPDGWKMTPDSTAVNGLTDELLTEKGFPVDEVLNVYTIKVLEGYVVAAFNASHDLKHMRGELRRAGRPDLFEQTPNVCLMRASVPICKIPFANGRSGFKYPKLSEASQFFGIEQPAAHSSTGDALSAVHILRHLHKLGALPKPEVHRAKVAPASKTAPLGMGSA